MRYYVTSDVHGFYSELVGALSEKGFFEDEEPHKLIICGDLFDRGSEALKLQEFILDLMSKDEVILVRGNHDDLALDLLNNWESMSYMHHNHRSNGTVDTILQLTNMDNVVLLNEPEKVLEAISSGPYIQSIIPAMVDYFETDNYIFTHGWIPCTAIVLFKKKYIPIDDWRNADAEAWDDARWVNGMEAARHGVKDPEKTIVCGHWHTSFGHSRYEADGGEFDNNPNFNPYYADGIIALDACTPFSGKVNCIVIEDTTEK